MKDLTKSKRKNILILLFFLLGSIVTHAKIDERLSTPVSFIDNAYQSKTELVVPYTGHYFLSSLKHFFPEKHETNFYSAHIDQLQINRFHLIYFNDFISHLIKSNKKFFVASNRIILIIQKSNTPHQSSEEHSFQLS